jgi:hypothetical protein
MSSLLSGIVYASLALPFNSIVKYVVASRRKKFYLITCLALALWGVATILAVISFSSADNITSDIIGILIANQILTVFYRALLLFLLSVRVFSIADYKKKMQMIIIPLDLGSIALMIGLCVKIVSVFRCMVKNDQECVAKYQNSYSFAALNVASDACFVLLALILDVGFFVRLIFKSIALRTTRLLKNFKFSHQLILYGMDIVLAVLNIYRIVKNGPTTVNNLSSVWVLNESVKFLIIIEFGLDIKEMIDSMTVSSMNRHNTNSALKGSYDMEIPQNSAVVPPHPWVINTTSSGYVPPHPWVLNTTSSGDREDSNPPSIPLKELRY